MVRIHPPIVVMRIVAAGKESVLENAGYERARKAWLQPKVVVEVVWQQAVCVYREEKNAKLRHEEVRQRRHDHEDGRDDAVEQASPFPAGENAKERAK